MSSKSASAGSTDEIRVILAQIMNAINEVSHKVDLVINAHDASNAAAPAKKSSKKKTELIDMHAPDADSTAESKATSDNAAPEATPRKHKAKSSELSSVGMADASDQTATIAPTPTPVKKVSKKAVLTNDDSASAESPTTPVKKVTKKKVTVVEPDAVANSTAEVQPTKAKKLSVKKAAPAPVAVDDADDEDIIYEAEQYDDIAAYPPVMASHFHDDDDEPVAVEPPKKTKKSKPAKSS